MEYRLTNVQKEVMRHVAEHPGCTSSELVSSVNYSHQSVINAVILLKEARMIHAEGTTTGHWGKRMECLYLSEEGRT